jgi:hypothetical protein
MPTKRAKIIKLAASKGVGDMIVVVILNNDRLVRCQSFDCADLLHEKRIAIEDILARPVASRPASAFTYSGEYRCWDEPP